MRKRLLALVMVLGFLAVACGEENAVGSDDLLKGLQDGKGGARLGEVTPAPDKPDEKIAVGGVTPPPAANATPVPPPKVSYFEVSLTADSPFYDPGTQLTMQIAAVLRVTNNDRTPERPTRSFTDKGNKFSSPSLKPGEVWTFKFPQGGKFEIIDQGLPFASATLEVR